MFGSLLQDIIELLIGSACSAHAQGNMYRHCDQIPCSKAGRATKGCYNSKIRQWSVCIFHWLNIVLCDEDHQFCKILPANKADNYDGNYRLVRLPLIPKSNMC